MSKDPILGDFVTVIVTISDKHCTPPILFWVGMQNFAQEMEME